MRKKSMDMAKGIGMLWIIFSHTGFVFPFAKYFYYMYVPIFFVCSGYFFQLGNSVKSDFKRITRKLFIPLLWCRLFYIVCTILSNHANWTRPYFSWSTLRIILRNNLYSRFCLYPYTYGGDNLYLSDFGGGEWFLPALILSSLFFALVLRFLKKRPDSFVKRGIIIGLLLTILSVLLNKLPILLPWSLDTIPTCVIFMLFGNFLQRTHSLDKPIHLKQAPLLLGMVVILKLITDYNLDINLSVRVYGAHGSLSVILYILNCINACYLTLIACKWLEKQEIFGFFTLTGRHTLLLYCINGWCMEFIAWIMYQTAAANYETGIFNWLKAMLCVCVGIAIDSIYRSAKPFLKKKLRAE